jgi:TM2 domain-containing membrane protein YozV
MLAGVMSALIPGSGQLYLGDYLKAGIFFAVDVALIATAISYNNKGDNKEAEFKAFADEHWSVVKYADYLIQHKEELGIPDDAEIPINRDGNLPPWEQIQDWSALNYAETPFSHHLPPHGDQQYYEQIGKYNQYSSGWDEFNPDIDGFRDVPQIMKDYAKMRGDANSAYNTASKLVIGVYINHLLSAIEAVWSAHRYNNNLAVNLRMKNIQIADRLELVPTVNFKYNF